MLGLKLNHVSKRGHWGPLDYYRLTSVPLWIGNYIIHYKVWYEITYPFTNLNGATAEVWEWKSNFIPHFFEHKITYLIGD